jgi:hypothetical protein
MRDEVLESIIMNLRGSGTKDDESDEDDSDVSGAESR